MAMGDLARLPNLGDLRPDEAGDSYDVPLDPWQRAMVAAQALEQRAPPQQSGNATRTAPNMGSLYGMAGAGERAKSIGESMARSADYYVGMPQRVMQGAPPETPGQLSEDDVARQDRLLAEQYGWAPSTALGMVFDPLGVKRSVGAGGVMLGSGAGSRIIQPTEGIRAYHSSPHDFEKFDFSPARARTGEGANVYGEGGYFAENPAVSGQGGQYWNQFLHRFEGPEQTAAALLKMTAFDREKALAGLQKSISHAADEARSPARLQMLTQARDLIESGKPVGPRTYEVNIKAKPDEMLNYDVPLKRQLPDVQARLKDVVDLRSPGTWGELEHTDPRAAIVHGFLGSDPRDASLRMLEAGIPGIRYLDEGSRAPAAALRTPAQKLALDVWTGDPAQAIRNIRANYRGTTADEAVAMLEGGFDPLKLPQKPPATHNYVMFPGTEDKVHIMAKYGLAGAVPTMGSLADMSYREQ